MRRGLRKKIGQIEIALSYDEQIIKYKELMRAKKSYQKIKSGSRDMIQR